MTPKTALEWFEDKADSSDTSGQYFWNISISEIKEVQTDARAELLERIDELEQSILHREGMNNDPEDLCEVHITFGDKPAGICTTYEHFKKIWRDD